MVMKTHRAGGSAGRGGRSREGGHNETDGQTSCSATIENNIVNRQPGDDDILLCRNNQATARYIASSQSAINPSLEPYPYLLVSLRIVTRMATRILPLELIDKAIGSQMWILLRGTKEVVGTLRGFDDYVSLGGRCGIIETTLRYFKAHWSRLLML
jgi:hypothetical protein